MSAKIFNMRGKSRILCIAAPEALAAFAEQWERAAGCTPVFASGRAEALRLLRSAAYDGLVAAFPLPDGTAEELLEEAQRIDSWLPVVILDAGASVADGVRLAKLGAELVLAGPMDVEEIQERLQAAVDSRPRRPQPATDEPWKQLLVGESRRMADVERIIRLVGPRRCTVLISGETGTGKERAARAIHLAGPRAGRPMVAVNCSALPENLLEAELFGHVKGAFTGAVQHRVGRFEQAHGGTLFLDEIGDLPLELQAKLLRVLQEREFQRLGSSETVKVDVRVIAASNVDLPERVRQCRFREDLYYRLNVIPVAMPPLRDRAGDIPALVCHFIQKTCRLEQIPVKKIAPESLERLAGYSWPGNVRQLENAVEMAVVMSGDRAVLYPGDFALPAGEDRAGAAATAGIASEIPLPDEGLDFEQTVSHIERNILEQALRRTRGNKKMAADMLHLKRTTLSAKLRSLEAAAV